MIRNKKAKLCLNTMVSNESHVILRMLNSCYKYIDYWIIQDNGSTDGTQDIIRNFFAEKNIQGFLYEIPWQFPGYNRDHALQTALQFNHGCDWILRIDADEVLQVSDNFDWSVFDNTNLQSFNIAASQGNCSYQRCWLWNAKLPWKFKHDKRHEIIYLDQDNIGEHFQRIHLSTEFKHLILGDGKTWHSPTKFFCDALEIEKDLLQSGKMNSDMYHLFYIAKSYRDSVFDHGSKFPFGSKHQDECLRRAIFYFNQYLNLSHDFENKKSASRIDEMAYMILVFMAECYKKLNDLDSALSSLLYADMFCPNRNEHLLEQAHLYLEKGDKLKLIETTKILMKPDRKNPFPHYCFFINNEAYYDSGPYVKKLHEMACTLNNIMTVA